MNAVKLLWHASKVFEKWRWYSFWMWPTCQLERGWSLKDMVLKCSIRDYSHQHSLCAASLAFISPLWQGCTPLDRIHRADKHLDSASFQVFNNSYGLLFSVLLGRPVTARYCFCGSMNINAITLKMQLILCKEGMTTHLKFLFLMRKASLTLRPVMTSKRLLIKMLQWINQLGMWLKFTAPREEGAWNTVACPSFMKISTDF